MKFIAIEKKANTKEELLLVKCVRNRNIIAQHHQKLVTDNIQKRKNSSQNYIFIYVAFVRGNAVDNYILIGEIIYWIELCVCDARASTEKKIKKL